MEFSDKKEQFSNSTFFTQKNPSSFSLLHPKLLETNKIDQNSFVIKQSYYHQNKVKYFRCKFVKWVNQVRERLALKEVKSYRTFQSISKTPFIHFVGHIFYSVSSSYILMSTLQGGAQSSTECRAPKAVKGFLTKEGKLVVPRYLPYYYLTDEVCRQGFQDITVIVFV